MWNAYARICQVGTLLIVCQCALAHDRSRVIWEVVFEPAAERNPARTRPRVLTTQYATDPVVGDGLVIVGTSHGWIRAYRSDDGKEAWRHKHEGRITRPPVIFDGMLFYTSSKGISALSMSAGEGLWFHPIELGLSACVAAPSHKVIVAGSPDGHEYAFDARTGNTLWMTDLVEGAPTDRPGFAGSNARVKGTLARPSGVRYSEGVIYQSIYDQSRVLAIDGKTGAKLWSYQANGWIMAAPAVSQDVVCVGSADRLVHCIDKYTGHKLWTSKTDDRIEADIVVDGRRLLCASCDGMLYCIRVSDGLRLWRFETGADYKGRRDIYAAPVVMGTRVYCASGAGYVYALNKNDGVVLWSWRVSNDSQIYSSPAIDRNKLFVVTRPDWDWRGDASLIAIQRE